MDSTKLYSKMMMFDVIIYGGAFILAIAGKSIALIIVAIIIAVIYSVSRQQIKTQLGKMLEQRGNKASAGNFTSNGQSYTPTTTFQGNNPQDQFSRGISGGKF